MAETRKMKSRRKISETEKAQAQLVMNCADIIRCSIRMSGLMQNAVNMDPRDLYASVTIAVGDLIIASGSPKRRKETLKTFYECLEDYVMNNWNSEDSREFS